MLSTHNGALLQKYAGKFKSASDELGPKPFWVGAEKLYKRLQLFQMYVRIATTSLWIRIADVATC